LENRPKSVHFVSPEKLIRAFRQKKRQNVRTKKLQYQRNFLHFNEKHMGKTMIVVRIRKNHGMTTLIHRILVRKFRLNAYCSIAFIKYSREVAYALKLIQPFVTYGLPSDQVIRDLLTKRAYCIHEKQRRPLSSNVFIETKLGQHNIVCLEDVIHELIHAGPNFKKVNNFLCPLHIKKTRFRNSRTPFKNGGDNGWRGKKINDLIENQT